MRTITILFDESYQEPALVTAFQVLTLNLSLDRLLLVFCPNEKPKTEVLGEDYPSAITGKCISNITAFAHHFRDHECQVSAIKLSGLDFLKQFNFAHFNYTILGKLFIPSLISTESKREVIINLDAGFLVGDQAVQTINTIFKTMSESRAVVGAFCDKFDDSFHQFEELSIRLDLKSCRKIPSLYPSGGVLGFNCINWQKAHFTERITQVIHRSLNVLKMAEQEVLLLSCDQSHLLNFYPEFVNSDVTFPWLTPFIHLGWPEKQKSLPIVSHALSRNFGLLKIVGSYKPWHNDFVDLIKLPYLQASITLYTSIPSLDPGAFSPFRQYFTQKKSPTNPDLLRYFIESDSYRLLAPLI
jgi:lipopolysaccharide biosynthesis glycosyltransferase